VTELPDPDRQTIEVLKIGIDGPAGAGKSTIARLLAERLEIPYIDTGSMYRAAALLAQRAEISPPYSNADGEMISELLSRHQIELKNGQGGARLLLDGEDVSREIRSPSCSQLASQVAALSEVREALVAIQRRIGAGGGVMEGRDIGTVVLPDADLKVYLTAQPEERARRRFQELLARGVEVTLEQVLEEQSLRDERDSSRINSPLKAADGAIVVDTTGLNPHQVVVRILEELPSYPKRALDSAERKP
jgi:cytidylate kinase